MLETLVETIAEQPAGTRKVYYPRSLDAGLRLIRHTRSKFGNRATCHLKVQAGEVVLTIEVK